jgi:hypothetical protein
MGFSCVYRAVILADPADLAVRGFYPRLLEFDHFVVIHSGRFSLILKINLLITERNTRRFFFGIQINILVNRPVNTKHDKAYYLI